MNYRFFFILIGLTLTACTLPVDAAPPPTALSTATTSPTDVPTSTFTPLPTLTETPLPTPTLGPTNALSFCNDAEPPKLLANFSNAIRAHDGKLLASLVSPGFGMDVSFYRNGKVINYDPEHAQFIFDSTYQADWGLSLGSGQPTIGAFKDIVLPSLKLVLTPKAENACNQIKTGGATYEPIWPYPYMDYYSVYYPGTNQFGGLDWETWAVGMSNVADKLYISALVHFVWEP